MEALWAPRNHPVSFTLAPPAFGMPLYSSHQVADLASFVSSSNCLCTEAKWVGADAVKELRLRMQIVMLPLRTVNPALCACEGAHQT